MVRRWRWIREKHGAKIAAARKAWSKCSGNECGKRQAAAPGRGWNNTTAKPGHDARTDGWATHGLSSRSEESSAGMSASLRKIEKEEGFIPKGGRNRLTRPRSATAEQGA